MTARERAKDVLRLTWLRCLLALCRSGDYVRRRFARESHRTIVSEWRRDDYLARAAVLRAWDGAFPEHGVERLPLAEKQMDRRTP